ncbi:hypothetical protein KP509_13G080200 [Ceratopteris richardii]|uniref:AAA+ ATPase domain-containing protein n=2 Tax=Ceratopteris richardii TaxID=49495 RepID=A0A8T2TH96_CERRI|nr:hypothetical protein KP509_13G080200 [Ceratopteris richardii]
MSQNVDIVKHRDMMLDVGQLVDEDCVIKHLGISASVDSSSKILTTEVKEKDENESSIVAEQSCLLKPMNSESHSPALKQEDSESFKSSEDLQAANLRSSSILHETALQKDHQDSSVSLVVNQQTEKQAQISEMENSSLQKGQIKQCELRRSTRIKKVLESGNCKGEESPKCLTSILESDAIPKSILNDFFVPASKKQKRPKVSDILVLDKTTLREKKPREEKGMQTQKASAGMSSKQDLGDDDFFKPVSKKQKKAEGKIEASIKEQRGERKSVFEIDLRMEAKIAAEENAQLCGGKPTHPFFSQPKGGQRFLSSVALPNNACLSQQTSLVQEIDLMASPPFHITQLEEAEIYTADKESWTCTNNRQEMVMGLASSRIECFDHSRDELDALLRIPFLKFPKKMQICRRGITSGRLVHDNILNPLFTFLKDFENDSKETNDGDNNDFSLAYLEDRLKQYLSYSSRNCSSVPSEMAADMFPGDDQSHRHLLWTDVYQPQSPKEICGNKNSVNILSAWLEKWQRFGPSLTGSIERNFTSRKMSSSEISEEDHNCFQDSDSGSELRDDGQLQNVLFLAGPVGSGKTAAVYACARLHGYTVIEVNASENRSGLLIKQKFSESMESHRVGNWSADTMIPVAGPTCTQNETFASVDADCIGRISNTDTKRGQKQKQKQKQKDFNNFMRFTEFPEFPNNVRVNSKDGQLSVSEQQECSKDVEKSLTVLLFEDIDMVFEDDRGFIAAITELAETAKRPIILTSNDKRLNLPAKLGADLLEFEKPSAKELLIVAYLICVAEGVSCTPEILLQMIKICNHDMRLLLNYLHFWSLGHNSDNASRLEDKEASMNFETAEMQSLSGFQDLNCGATIRLFELEAQHRLWPSLLPLEFVCPVAETVACEMNKMISQLEAQFQLEEVMRLEKCSLQKHLNRKLQRQEESPPRTEKDVKLDGVDETLEAETDLLETPVKNVKDVKAVSTSPMMNGELQKGLASTMLDSAVTGDNSNEEYPVLMSPTKVALLEDSILDDLSEKKLCIPVITNVDASVSIEFDKAPSPENKAVKDELPGEDSVIDVPIGPELKLQNIENPLTVSSQAFLFDHDESILRRISESVDLMWSDYRANMENFHLNTACKTSLVVTSSLSRMLENLSICDVISSHSSLLGTERLVPGCVQSCYGNLENSSILQICAMVAQTSFTKCIEECWACSNIQDEAKTEPSIKDLMLALNDPCALGSLVTDKELLHISRCVKPQDVPLSSQERDLERLSSLRYALHSELPLKAQGSLVNASFFEDTNFLARIGFLEQERLTLGTRRRGRGSLSYFRTHPWNLSKETTSMIERFGKFGACF